MKTQFLLRTAMLWALALAATGRLALGAEVNPVLVGAWWGPSGGTALDVVVSGRYALLANWGGGLNVIDVSDVAAPRLVGEFAERGAVARDVEVSGNLACVVDGDAGLLVPIDVSNPANPQWLSRYEVGDSFSGFALQGNHAYLATWRSGLRVIDLSDPAKPRQVGAVTNDFRVNHVAVAGNYAYAAAEWNEGGVWIRGLRVIDISDPTNPSPIGGCPTPGVAMRVAVSGRYAYVTGSYDELYVIDISDPAAPRLAGRYASARSVGRVVVSGDHAYLVETWWDAPSDRVRSRLEVIDVADPTNPRRVGGYDSFIWLNDIAARGNYVYLSVYLSSPNRGVFVIVIDVSNPAVPRLAGTSGDIELTPGIAVSDNFVYVAKNWAGFQILDVSNPANVRTVGECKTYRQFDALAVAVRGTNAFVVGGELGLWVFDFSDPANLRKISVHPTSGWARDVAIAGHHAFVSADNGLDVIDISNPSDLRRVGLVTNLLGARVMVSGNRLFAAGFVFGESPPQGVLVLDISDPTNPRRIGACEVGGSARSMTDLAVSGDHLFVSGGMFVEISWDGRPPGYREGLLVIDISDPANPRRAGAFDFLDHSQTVAVWGNYAFVGVSGSLEVIDVSNPAAPRRVGGSAWPEPHGMIASQDRIFVAAGGSLAIIEMLPFIKSIAKDGPNIKLAWEGFGPARLQRATRLTNPDWQDLIGSENTNTVTLPTWGGPEFFRLVRP